MSPRAEQERLRDIERAIKAIKSHIARTQDEPSLTYSCTTPCCTSSSSSERPSRTFRGETRAQAPEMPWQDIAGLRDLIAHEYFQIDIQRVLEIVEHDRPL